MSSDMTFDPRPVADRLARLATAEREITTILRAYLERESPPIREVKKLEANISSVGAQRNLD